MEQLWTWGYNNYGVLGQNSVAHYSSPVQVPGTTWGNTANSAGRCYSLQLKLMEHYGHGE